MMDLVRSLCNCLPGLSTSEYRSTPIFVKLNDSVYELYKPQLEEPELEILFFHGLQLGDYSEAFWATWMSGDGSEVWPQTWLAEVFPRARILSISYDSSLKKSSAQGRLDLDSIGETLMDSVINLTNVGQQPLRPVILVGHSFGGIVMKKLVVQAYWELMLMSSPSGGAAKVDNFLKNLRGLFYYGTPHHGMPFANTAAAYLNGPLLDFVKLLSTETEQLNVRFQSISEKFQKWQVAGVWEAHATKWGHVVVPPASARVGNSFAAVPADHLSLCKPMDRTANSFLLLKKFIEDVLLQMQEEARVDNVQWIPGTIIGIEPFVEKVLLRLEKTAQLCLVGMGGIGKSTLAKAVFNILGPKFEYSCFVPDVKMNTRGVDSVMRDVWKHMYYRGKTVEGTRNDWASLKGKSLLLVLDDISSEDHLQVLTTIADCSSLPESRFICTSRNRKLLDDSFQVTPLGQENAEKLFINLAFPNQGQPPSHLEEYVSQVVEICAGLPLTLEVVGKYLRRHKQEEFWKESLQKLAEAENLDGTDEEKLWAKLRLSYDGLMEKEKEMFLDAATFFNNEKLSEAKVAWSMAWKSEHSRWETLVTMSLVYEIEENANIRMHEQLRSLGRKIASESGKDGKCSRIWESQRAFDMLSTEDFDGVEEIVGLRLRWDELKQGIDPQTVECFRHNARRALSRMTKLRYLDFDCGKLDGSPDIGPLSTTLVLLRLSNSQFIELPFSPALYKNLTVLQVYFPQFHYLPSTFGQLSNLKILELRCAQNLESLPNEFCKLLRLQRFECFQCERLRAIPDRFGELMELKDLAFSDCPSLESLPSSFCQLARLERLELSRGTELRGLPESFGQLLALRRLSLKHCSKLEELPASVGQLELLGNLDLSGSRVLKRLPKSFGLLRGLKVLLLNDCSNLTELRESFGQLQLLEHLNLEGCKVLERLPDSFGLLRGLKILSLKDCSKLAKLPESFGQLSSLGRLTMSGCEGLLTLPDSLGRLGKLNLIDLDGCARLKRLPESFGRLSELEWASFQHCTILEELPATIGQFSRMHYLCIMSCSSLRTLPSSLGNLNLKGFNLWFCPKIEALPENFGQMEDLKALDFLGWRELRTVPDSFGKLSRLEFLRFSDCFQLETLPDSMGQLKALRQLTIEGARLRSIPDWIENLPALQELQLGKLSAVQSWPSRLGAATALVTRSNLGFDVIDGQFVLRYVEDEDDNSNAQTSSSQLSGQVARMLGRVQSSFSSITMSKTFELVQGQNLEHRYLRIECPFDNLEMIQVEVHSHDQGFSDWAWFQGTTIMSWTWAEVGVLSAGGEEVAGRIRIYTNKNACWKWQRHLYLIRKKDFLRSIKPGFTVVLWLRSKYPGWSHFACYGSIELFPAGEEGQLFSNASTDDARGEDGNFVGQLSTLQLPESSSNVTDRGQFSSRTITDAGHEDGNPVTVSMTMELVSSSNGPDPGQFSSSTITDAGDEDGNLVTVSVTVELVEGQNLNHRYVEIECPFPSLEKINVEVESHDQGWSSDPRNHGTYDNCWTWGEVGILDPEGNEVTERIRVYTNKHAHREWQRHSYTVKDATFLRNIKPGFTVAVWLRSAFPGWTNFARYGSIELVPKGETPDNIT